MKTAGIFEITPSELETFLKLLLSDGIVSSILAPEAKKERTRVTPTFISDAKQIENLPISDLMVYHYNLINSAATTMFQSKRSINEKVAVIARSSKIGHLSNSINCGKPISITYSLSRLTKSLLWILDKLLSSTKTKRYRKIRSFTKNSRKINSLCM